MKTAVWRIIILMFLLGSPLAAQGKFFLGATGGVNSMKLSGDTPDDGSYTSKIGFSGGLIGEYSLTGDINLSIQPSYVRRGTGVAVDVGEKDPRDSLALSLDYLSIPLLARFLSPGRAWFANGGFDLGLLLDASLKDITTGAEKNVKSAINSVDLMMLVGAGTIFHADPVLITLELRYSQSLGNAGANDALSAVYGIPVRFRSSGFQLLVAVMLPL
jgi:hypothetical protein